NANVDKLNAVIRKHLYKTDQPFIVGEVVVMQEPLVTEGRVNGVSFVEVIYNNNEQIKILEIIPRSDTIKADRCDPVQIDYFLMKTESMFEDTKADIQVIADPVMQERLGDYLNYVAFQYKKMKQETGYKAPWYSFWQIKNKFQTVKALPVCT
ncbi:SH3 domain-containing protein, partial [Enterobacter hormaechei]